MLNAWKMEIMFEKINRKFLEARYVGHSLFMYIKIKDSFILKQLMRFDIYNKF